MNKLVRLIYVNLVENLNINMINEAKEAKVKDSSEIKLVLMGILGILFGILLYRIYDYLGYMLVNRYYVLGISLLISTVFVFVSNLVIMENTLFRGNDVEMLYSFPLTKGQIVLSKLFNVYVRNLFFILIINFPAILAFANYIKVTELVGMLFFLFSLVVPLIPIVITSLLSYFNAYMKARGDKKLFFLLIRLLFIGLVLGLVFLLFVNINVKNMDSFFKAIFNRSLFIYPFIEFFYKALLEGNAFYTYMGIIIPIFIFYVFVVFLADNYIKLISLLKGVRVNNKFIIGNPKNSGKVWGMIKKETYTVLHDKTYFMHTIGLQLIGTVLVIIVCIVNPLERLQDVEYITEMFNMIMPSIMACFSSLCCTTISSLSLERDNLAILRSMPISFGSILVNKALTNILIALPLAILNVLILGMMINTNRIVIAISLIYSIFSIIFVSILGLTLDLRFIDNREKDKNVIIKQRLVTFVPLIVSGVIGVSAFVLPIYVKYYYVIGAYVTMELIGVIICVCYILINRKNLLGKIKL